MAIRGYFHVCLMHGINGSLVASEMHGRILQSGLYDASESISVTILSEDQAQALHLKSYIWDWYPKYNVRHVSMNLGEWEWPTIRMIKEDCRTGDDLVWYAHTKGVSNCRSDVAEYTQSNIRNWRGVLCEALMDHRSAVELLGTGQFSAVGPLFVEKSRAPLGHPHFAGNFWWATSQHVRELPALSDEWVSNRNRAEEYIGSGTGRLGPLSSCGKTYDLYDFAGEYEKEGGPLSGLAGSRCHVPEHRMLPQASMPFDPAQDARGIDGKLYVSAVNMGCNDIQLQGHLNVDLDDNNNPQMVYDVTKMDEVLADGSVNHIYCGHLLEHLTHEQGAKFLQVCKRALAPHGVLTVVVPDWRKAADRSVHKTTMEAEGTILGRGQHVRLYDEEVLVEQLSGVFSEVHIVEPSSVKYCIHKEFGAQTAAIAINPPEYRWKYPARKVEHPETAAWKNHMNARGEI